MEYRRRLSEYYEEDQLQNARLEEVFNQTIYTDNTRDAWYVRLQSPEDQRFDRGKLLSVAYNQLIKIEYPFKPEHFQSYLSVDGGFRMKVENVALVFNYSRFGNYYPNTPRSGYFRFCEALIYLIDLDIDVPMEEIDRDLNLSA